MRDSAVPGNADISRTPRNACLWRKADITIAATHIRFRGQSGHRQGVMFQMP
jgi:hypothetical protein